jgi:YVTN family beta-propeller protein
LEHDVARRALRTVRLEGSADFLEVVGDSLWVTNEPRNRVHRLDARTGAEQAQVEVAAPCGAMTVATGGLWVASLANQGLVRVDLATNAAGPPLRTGLADPAGELSLAATPEGVWLTTSDAGVVSLVDPASREVVAQVPVKPRSYALAAGFGSVWVANTGQVGEAGSVQRLDPKGRRVVAEIATGPQPRFLAVGEGAVWTLNQGDGTVTRIDPATDRAFATIPVGVPGTGGDIATGHGFVWVRANRVLLSVIDVRTNAVVARYGPRAGSGAVRAAADGVWVSAHDVNLLWLLPPTP